YSKDGKMHSNNKINSALPLPHPVLAEGTKARQGLAIVLPVCGGLARDNIVDVADRNPPISCACRYSNAAIAQPAWQVLLTPAPVISRRVEGPERRVVHDRFVGANERVAKARFQRSPRRRFELRHPFGQDRRLLDRAVLHLALFYLVRIHGRLLHCFFDPSQQKPVTYSPPMQQRIPNSVLNPSPPLKQLTFPSAASNLLDFFSPKNSLSPLDLGAKQFLRR